MNTNDHGARADEPGIRTDPLDRRQFLRGLAGTGALAGAGGLLAACSSGSSTPAASSPTATSARKRGGSLKVGLTGGSGSDTLDPHNGLTYLDTARAQSLYQPLLQLNTRAQAEFVLAEEISPRGSTSQWVIRLRPGITFHDGKPLTADDVIFTLSRIKNKKLTGSTPLGPVDVKGLKKLDKRTVLVPMTSPYGSFLDQLAYWYYLYVVPVGFNPSKPNGTGAFKYQSFTPGQRSVFVRNPNYWKPGLPYVDTLTIIDFSDSASLQNALVTGVIHGAGALEGAQIAALKSAGSVRTVTSHTGAITPFTMRVDQAPFNDVNVRQAMRLLVLKKAGHENLTVQLVTSPVATGTVAMSTVLKQQAQAAGVTINLKQVDPTTFFGPNYLHWTFSQDFYNYSPYLAQVAQSLLPTSPFNETHWSLPHYIDLNKQANATANASTRKQIEHEMQMIDFNQGGYIIPAFIAALDALLVRLNGGRTSSWNPHCSPPASASQRARLCWAMGGSCSATATPASCWPTPTAPFPPSPAPAAHRGAPCSARTAPST